MRALYGTADGIGGPTGGGAVTLNEAMALEAISEKVVVLSGLELAPARFRQPDSVFLPDYFALMMVQGQHFDLAHFYSGTFSATVRYLKERGTVVTYTVPAHDRKTTVEEHMRLVGQYPWPHIKDPDLWAVFSRGYRDADQVIAPSRKAAQVLSTEGCQNVEVIPHGCELPSAVAPLPGQFTVGYLGQVGVDKGIFYLLKAWEKLNYPNAQLLMAGPGKEALEGMIRSFTNGGRFKLLGFVPQVSDFYNSISVYVQPSIAEAFGIEVLEAFAHSRPVIASEGAGASELVAEGTGWIVPIRNPGAIAERLAWCRKNQGQLVEMGLRAKKVAEEHTWAKTRLQYQALWRSIVSPSSAAGAS